MNRILQFILALFSGGRSIEITAQDLRELWGMLPGLSLAPLDEAATAQWLKAFPGGLALMGIDEGK